MIPIDKKNRMLEASIAQYGRLIFTICNSMTGDSFEAEDLAQDTFLSAYKHLDTFHGDNMKAWLVTIASNKCRDYLKSAARRSVAASGETFDLVRDKGPEPEEVIVNRDTEKRVLDLSRSLKEPYQSIAIAYFCEHKTAQDISRATGKNLKTTQTQIYRTRSMMRKLWKEEFG
jgi:RNA polymerase sigma-70 factor (ECF subfamily)